MSKIKKLHKSEPVLTGFGAIVSAAIGVFVAFGGHVTDGQTAALVALAVVATPIIVWVRNRVSPSDE